ncbi:hypothetical protein EJV46_15265 [Roseococcus sp. SYP-B2431]|uniref:hypothetical protein n=1 Tax=Roseococcus sp. SYP-B2431 TaxID=2496640 RepID=UPI00103F81D6|nr:hypothetical protein [Roseococcus sp. SYP-B2431]TCH97485.1 hypothetical protein EJV46_15265 [Roseococcus sp. SYP-B2431]
MRALLLLSPLLAACAAPPGGGTSGCDGRIQLRNAAPIAVEQLYVSMAGPSDWGRDHLAPGTLPAGSTQSVMARPGINAVRVVFVNGRAAEMTGMDVCATPVLTVQPNGLQAGR